MEGHTTHRSKIRPMPEKSTDPTAEKSTELIAEKSTEPISEKSTEPIAERSTEPIAEKSTEPIAQKSTEPIAQKSTEPIDRANAASMSRRELPIGVTLPKGFGNTNRRRSFIMQAAALRRGMQAQQASKSKDGSVKTIRCRTPDVRIPTRSSILPDVVIQAAKAPKKHLLISQYPAPIPPCQPKSEVFNHQRYIALDNFVTKVPTSILYGDFDEVVSILTKNCSSDMDRLRVLYAWTTSVELTTLQSCLERLPDRGTPLDYLLRINWKMGDYPHFFAILCRSAGIPIIIINGMSKNSKYELGRPVDRTAMAAQWNAVYVAGEWRLIDSFWGSQCIIDPRSEDWEETGKHDIPEDDESEPAEGELRHFSNDAYFLINPDEMIHTHFPDQSVWQLLFDPVTLKTFEKRALIRERFHHLGMTLLEQSQTDCIVQTKGGKVEFVFGTSEDRAADIRFKCLLFHETWTTTDCRIDQHVFHKRFKTYMSFKLSIPVAGRFKLHIYGIDQKRDVRYDLCVAYLIDCIDPIPSGSLEPLPDIPVIGWGPGIQSENVGLLPLTHEDAVIHVRDGIDEIRFAMTYPLTVTHDLKNFELADLPLSRHVVMRMENNDELVLNVRLPFSGDYALNIYAAEADAKGDLPNVCNFLIKVDEENNHKSFPKVREGYIGRGMFADEYKVDPKSHLLDVIDTDTGHLCIEFEVKRRAENSASDVELFAELHNHDVANSTLVECMVYVTRGDIHVFDVKLPDPGEYAVNVYARRICDTGPLRHIHTYLIDSTQEPVKSEPSESDYFRSPNLSDTTPSQDCAHSPCREMSDISIMSFGRAHEARTSTYSGRRKAPPKKVHVVTMNTAQHTAVIRIPTGDFPRLYEYFRRNTRQDSVTDLVEYRKVGTKYIFKVKLDELGEYNLDVFEQFQNIIVQSAQYRIIRCERHHLTKEETEAEQDPEDSEIPLKIDPLESVEVFDPEEATPEKDAQKRKRGELLDRQHDEEVNWLLMSQKLQVGCDRDDESEIAAAITAFQSSGINEKHGELKHAQLELKAKPMKRELCEAMNSRVLARLHKAIHHAESTDMQDYLGLVYQMACQCKDHLCMIETARRNILKFNHKTIYTMRAYRRPPKAVHFIMAAAYILLGEPASSVRDWRTIVIMLGSMDRMAFKRRIQDFDIDMLKIETALTSKLFLEKVNFGDLQVVDTGADVVYAWTSAEIEEAECRYEQTGGDVAALQVTSVNKYEVKTFKRVVDSLHFLRM